MDATATEKKPRKGSAGKTAAEIDAQAFDAGEGMLGDEDREDDIHAAGSEPSRQEPQRPAGAGKSGRGFLRGGPLRAFRQLLFSSLAKRILFLNLSALAVLLSGILYLNQFREGLVEAYTRSLVTQGRIIARAIAASATYDVDTFTIDPDKLMELQAGESVRPSRDILDDIASGIDPEVVAPLLRDLVQPTRTRARIYDENGGLILDSRFLYSGGQVLRYDLPGAESSSSQPDNWVSYYLLSHKGLSDLLNWLLRDRSLPVYEDYPDSGRQYPEVRSALTGSVSTFVRVDKDGKQIVSVAVPVQRYRVVSGVLMLSTEAGEIDRFVTDERLVILRIFLVATVVIFILSLILAGTIASPLRKLSEAANRVRRGVNSREEIPDFSGRHDEIGVLSTSIRDMTNALYSRIEAIERFAADVSHELKNPLTSLRSAVETLPLAKTSNSQERLHEVIQHDVRRLDRLITDISDASRLDAELAREQAEDVDIRQLLENVTSMLRPDRGLKRGDKTGQADIRLAVSDRKASPDAFKTRGHEDRLAQVIINLIENAKGFVPAENGVVRLNLARTSKDIVITVEDNGPGIPEDNLERIFERFYTDRPEEQGFGQNSGLGLSISRQIVEAHGGTIRAENISAKGGARFIVTLPQEGRRK